MDLIASMRNIQDKMTKCTMGEKVKDGGTILDLN